MPRVLLATDADWIHEEVDAAIAGDDIEVFRVRQGVEVLPAVQAGSPDLVVLDLQIGNMGGMASCMDIRLDESVGNRSGRHRWRRIPVVDDDSYRTVLPDVHSDDGPKTRCVFKVQQEGRRRPLR